MQKTCLFKKVFLKNFDITAYMVWDRLPMQPKNRKLPMESLKWHSKHCLCHDKWTNSKHCLRASIGKIFTSFSTQKLMKICL